MSQDRIHALVSFGPFILDRDERRLLEGEREVELPERSLRLLEILVDSPGRTLSKDRLVEGAWAGAHVSDTSLTEAVCRLRTALGDDAREPRYVRTVHGRGYQFIAALGTPRPADVVDERPWRPWRVAAAAAVLLSTVGWGIGTTQQLGRGWSESVQVALERVRGAGDAREGRAAAQDAVIAASAVLSPPRYRLAELDTEGVVTNYSIPPLPLSDLSVDRSGKRVAVSIADGGESDVWLVEPSSGELRRIATGGFFSDPVWAPDGEAVALARRAEGDFDLVLQRVGASGGPEPLLAAPLDQFPESWSRDGRLLVYAERHPETRLDLWLLERSSTGEWSRRPLIRSEGDEAFAAISPDGRWVAYTTAVRERPEVFVLDLAGARPPVQISEDGGAYPFWSVAGDRLHYLRGSEVWGVTTTALEGRPSPEARRSAVVEGLYLAGGAAISDRIVVAVREPNPSDPSL